MNNKNKVEWRYLLHNADGLTMERVKAVCMLVAPLRKREIYGSHNSYYLSWNLTEYEFECAIAIYKSDIPTAVLLKGTH